MKLIGNESKAEMEAYKKITKERAVRFDTDLLFTSSIWIGGEYLIMTTTSHHPFYAVEMRDKTLTHNMREIFKKLWRGSAV